VTDELAKTIVHHSAPLKSDMDIMYLTEGADSSDCSPLVARSREAMTAGPNNSRYEQVTSLRKAGLTYAEIGRKLGLTRERVRQIAKAEPKAKKKPARDDPDALLTTTEAAELLNVHVNTVRRWSNKGMLETYRIGSRGDRRLRRRDVDKLLRKSQPADIA